MVDAAVVILDAAVVDAEVETEVGAEVDEAVPDPVAVAVGTAVGRKEVSCAVGKREGEEVRNAVGLRVDVWLVTVAVGTLVVTVVGVVVEVVGVVTAMVGAFVTASIGATGPNKSMVGVEVVVGV